jgi:hypothetical protein
MNRMRPLLHRLDAAALGALALALPGLWLDATAFFACWLAAWWYLLGLVMGGLVNLWMHRLTGGRWGEALRPPALAAARALPWLLLLFVPLAAGWPRLYPWAAGNAGWTHDIARPAFVLAWLSPGFVALRVAAYALLWWWLSRPAVLARKGASAAALMLYTLSGTLAAIDLLMSLVPGWYSTAFGLVVLSGQALGGAALPVVLRSRDPPADAPWRDLGNLLLMWLMTWAYLAFMEFLIIWAENLPREIAWYLPRLQTGWRMAGIALVLAQFALPLLCLLWRSVKDQPRRLRLVAVLLLAAQLLNTAWLVLPSVQPHGVLAWWLLPLLVLAMGLPMWTRLDVRGRTASRSSAQVSHAAS